MSQIDRVHARQILDSRGNPTVEVEVALRSGASGPRRRAVRRLDGRVRGHRAARRRRALARQGRHAAPSRTSTARSPAAVAGLDAADQRGARPRAAASSTARRASRASGPTRSSASRSPSAHAAAAEEGLPLWRYLGGEAAHVLPVPMMNVLNGGAHADNKVDFQEFMVVPVRRALVRRGAAHGRRGLPRAEGARCTSAGLATAVGDEGGFAPDLELQRGRRCRC